MDNIPVRFYAQRAKHDVLETKPDFIFVIFVFFSKNRSQNQFESLRPTVYLTASFPYSSLDCAIKNHFLVHVVSFPFMVRKNSGLHSRSLTCQHIV